MVSWEDHVRDLPKRSAGRREWSGWPFKVVVEFLREVHVECSRCKYSVAVAAGKYRDAPWEETPCARCEYRDQSSIYTIRYNEDRGADLDNDADDPDVANGGLAVGRECHSVGWGSSSWNCVDAEPEGEEADPLLPLSVLGDVVRGLMWMEPATRDTVCLRYQGLKYREIAARQGGTVSAAETRHWRAMTRWPELKALFALKAAKRARKGKERG